MKEWTYKNILTPGPLHDEVLTKEFGHRGWELVTVIPNISIDEDDSELMLPNSANNKQPRIAWLYVFKIQTGLRARRPSEPQPPEGATGDAVNH